MDISLNGMFGAMADGGEVYAASGDLQKVYKIGHQGILKTYDLKNYEGLINTLIVSGDNAWVGVGSTILKIANDQVIKYATVQTIVIGHPIFCIAQSRMYMADGNTVRIADAGQPQMQNYIANGPLSENQIQEETQMRTALPLGMYCAEETDADPIIYARSVDIATNTAKLMAIRPLL